MTGSELLLHGLLLFRMTGSGLLFQAVSHLLILLYETHIDMSTPKITNFKLWGGGAMGTPPLKGIISTDHAEIFFSFYPLQGIHIHHKGL